MKVDEIPQDNNKTYQGHGTKAVYAVNGQGRYTKQTTSGWEVEEVVLREALADLENRAADAKARVLAGQTSPIEYFLYKRLMDLSALAQAMGMAKWRVKRHLKPKVFQKLSDSLLQQYADLFRIDLHLLKNFKENTSIDSDS
jgi:hypothetical protein